MKTKCIPNKPMCHWSMPLGSRAEISQVSLFPLCLEVGIKYIPVKNMLVSLD